ncbi:MAG: histidine--tRNA ligase [Planctomycetota bacterium]
MALVEPRLLDGFCDFPPDVSSLRNHVVERIGRVFEAFGFAPMRTPAIEHADMLVGQYGQEAERQVYRLTDNGQRVALRADLTVPLARHVAMNHRNLKLPIRRYQTGMIFSVNPTGRSRESMVCDADIVGTRSSLADAECIALAHALLKELGVHGATICFNNRKIYRGLQNVMGLDESRFLSLLRLLNRMATIGEEEVRRALTEDVKLPEKDVARVFETLTLPVGTLEARLDEAAKRFSGSQLARAAVSELREVLAGARALGVPDEALEIDLFTTRSLDYYTSTVFKTRIASMPGFSSVISGGRYDDLVSVFLGQMVPAVGLGVRVDQLVEALQKLGRTPPGGGLSLRALVVVPGPSQAGAAMSLATELRNAGVSCEFTFDPAEPMTQQLRRAATMKVPFTVQPTGRPGEVVLQSIADGSEASVTLAEAVDAIRSWTPDQA